MSSSEPFRGARAGILACALVLAGVTLGGCGFHPLYGSETAAETDETLAAVAIRPISERIGQILANILRDSFNPTGAKVPTRYVLTVTLQTTNADLAIRKDGTASRELIAVTGSFSMYEFGNVNPLLTGAVRANNSYDIGENPYSVIVANTDAQTRAAQQIGADIRARVALYFKRRAAGA